MMIFQIRSLKIIDTLILIFFSVFLLTLTNSIFLNQLGYYISLLLLLARFTITKKNGFSKTGLETAFLLYILAEILSSIFSEYPGASFNNTLKRALLIPIVYTAVAVVPDIKRGKFFFKIYIAASLITVVIYLYYSYQHYIMNLYGITESGPSIFQYPITASEIMSFTVIYLFTFLIHERMNYKNKILIFILFALSLLALFSTYKRTGWLGAAFGIFIILLLKKQWKILIPLTVLGIIIILIQENKNIVNVFDYDKGTIKKTFEFSTDGRAYNILPEDNRYFISDFENGLLEYQDSVLINKYEFPAPVTDFNYWTDNFYIASLIDSRFILLNENGDSLNKVAEFYTTGFTSSYKIFQNNFYVLDIDSGLTVFRNPENLSDKKIYKNISGFSSFFIDSSFIVIFSRDGLVKVIENESGLPGKTITDFKHKNHIKFITFFNSNLFLEDREGLKLYIIDSSGINFKSSSEELKQLYQAEVYDEKLFLSSLDGNIYELQYPVDTLKVNAKIEIGFAPSSFTFHDNRIYASSVQRSRILSIFDPYHPSNTVRFALWEAGWRIFKDHPLFGVGDIDLQHYYKLYKKEYNKEILGHMHNNFMHILTTIGLFGFLTFLYLIIKIFQVDYRIFNETRDEIFLSSFSLGTLGSFAAFLFAGLTELNFGDHEIITLVWFTLGLNIAFYKLKSDSKSAE